ncbi:hypothetical protein BDV32DRAFT_82827 [Aspergillus pseudonomiae]|nr:hypothetical protein BDV32DRAFT_82827 [Aspergillus pseudonomiae]
MASLPRHLLAPWLLLPTFLIFLSHQYLLDTSRARFLFTVPQDFPDCVSAIQPRTPVTYMSPTIMGRDTTWATKTTQFTEITNVHAFPVQGWNINDTGAGPATVTATATSSFDATSFTSTHGPIPGSNGLSAGAKVGLGVGITMAITGVMVGAFLVYLRIKRRAEKRLTTELHSWGYGREPSEFETPVHSAAQLPAIQEPTEMEGQPSLRFGVSSYLHG